MTAREILRKNPPAVLLLLWMGLVPLLFSALAGYEGWQQIDWLKQLTYGEWSWFYLGSVFTMAFALTPTTFIATLSGYFLGIESLYYLVPSYLLASLLGYAIAKRVGKSFFDSITVAYPSAAGLIGGLKRREFWLVVLCRISPVLPFAIMNVVLSYARIGIKPFVLGGLLGMLPRTTLAILLGMQVENLVDGSLQSIIWISLLALSLLGFGLLFRNALKMN